MVHIIADTTSCIFPQVAEKYHIPVIPQVINFGSQSYLEGIDLSIDDFMQRLMTDSQLPKTAAPPPELFVKEFARLVPTGETILCIHPSLDVSGTVRSALTAKEEFPGADIRVIDTRLIASPLSTVIETAAKMAQEGQDAGAIEARISEMSKRCRIYFVVATLEYLAKGGRIGGASALLGSMLQIKPILTFENGKVNVMEKVRTHKQALVRLKELVTTQALHGSDSYVSVMQAGVPTQGQALAEELCAQLGVSDIPVHHMPPAIVTHGGPGLLAVGFFI